MLAVIAILNALPSDRERKCTNEGTLYENNGTLTLEMEDFHFGVSMYEPVWCSTSRVSSSGGEASSPHSFRSNEETWIQLVSCQ